MKIVHEMARRRMPLLFDDENEGKLSDHVASCISCQAEASRYRSLRRVLGTFSHELYEPPFDLVPGVMGSLDRPYQAAKRQVRAGAAAGAAVAVAGLVVVAKLVRRRAA